MKVYVTESDMVIEVSLTPDGATCQFVQCSPVCAGLLEALAHDFNSSGNVKEFISTQAQSLLLMVLRMEYNKLNRALTTNDVHRIPNMERKMRELFATFINGQISTKLFH